MPHQVPYISAKSYSQPPIFIFNSPNVRRVEDDIAAQKSAVTYSEEPMIWVIGRALALCNRPLTKDEIVKTIRSQWPHRIAAIDDPSEGALQKVSSAKATISNALSRSDAFQNAPRRYWSLTGLPLVFKPRGSKKNKTSDQDSNSPSPPYSLQPSPGSETPFNPFIASPTVKPPRDYLWPSPSDDPTGARTRFLETPMMKSPKSIASPLLPPSGPMYTLQGSSVIYAHKQAMRGPDVNNGPLMDPRPPRPSGNRLEQGAASGSNPQAYQCPAVDDIHSQRSVGLRGWSQLPSMAAAPKDPRLWLFSPSNDYALVACQSNWNTGGPAGIAPIEADVQELFEDLCKPGGFERAIQRANLSPNHTAQARPSRAEWPMGA